MAVHNSLFSWSGIQYTNTQGGAGGKTITIGKNNVLCESTKQTKSIFIEKFEKNICMQKVRPACK